MSSRSPNADRAPVAPSPESVLSKSVVRAADVLSLPNNVLARILGLSESTVSRLKKGTYTLKRHDKEFELAQIFVRLFRSLDAITGGNDETSRSWLASENVALRGKPIELMQSIPGLMSTLAYVDSRRASI